MTGPRLGRRDTVTLWDGRVWPCDGWHAGAPVFRYRWAPAGLSTTRQLAARGLRPFGQEPVGYLFGGEHRWAYLYRDDLARPKRTNPRLLEAIAELNTRRRTCPCCRDDVGYRIPADLGVCHPCSQLAQVPADPAPVVDVPEQRSAA